MTERTITESELEEATSEFFNDHMVREMTVSDAMTAVLKSLGFTVVPDPMPEPEGDVFVVDSGGDIWIWSHVGWILRSNQASRRKGPGLGWEELRREWGPLKVYRADGATG